MSTTDMNKDNIIALEAAIEKTVFLLPAKSHWLKSSAY